MSMRGDKLKNGTSTFSDQITSRLHRWVQRTTTKGRNKEKGTNIRNLRHENNHAVKDNDLNIKQCSPPPQKSNPSNKDTRTILELEKALKDLINNCVTNAASSPSGSEGASFVGDGVRLSMMTTKYITKDNGDEVGSNRGETSGDDDIAEVGWQTQKGRHGKNVDGALSASGLSQQNRGNYATCETTLVANPGANAGETVGVEKNSLPSGTRNLPKDSEKNISKRKEHTDVTLFCQTDEGNTKTCEDRNHPSTSSSELTTDVDTSVRNTNNGLSAGSLIKTQHRMYYGRQNTVEGKGSGDVKNSSPKQRPPLRRIQSEGDSIAKRFSFNNRDVSEFAKTCIRHAQKKRLSQANSLDSDVDSLSDMVFGEAGQQVSTRPSPEFAVPRNLPLRSSARDSGNVSDFDPSAQDALQHSPLSDRPSSLSDVDMDLQASRLSPQSGVLSGKHPLRSGTRDSGNVSDIDPGSPNLATSRPNDQHVVSSVHTTLSDRLSSLSFPLERNKAKNINKQSFFKNKSSNTATSEDSCSPQSSKKRATNRLNSPTFRKFPCQPVFYVPGVSSAPLAIPSKKTGRSKSLTESKHGNSEHLI